MIEFLHSVCFVLKWFIYKFQNSNNREIEKSCKKIIKFKKYINFHNIWYLSYGLKMKDNSDKIVAGTSIINIKLFGRL